MKTQPFRHPAYRSKGVTLIEILMVVGVLVILLSFAMPSVSDAAIKAEMSAATENVQYSLQMARKAARRTESEWTMHVSPALENSAQSITFTSSGGSVNSQGIQLQDFTLPGGIALVSNQDSFVFNGRGLVQNPGRILLVSREDENVTTVIEIQ
jgi:prepilin-type N-terminal cleavage/methylation domain-containing protein